MRTARKRQQSARQTMSKKPVTKKPVTEFQKSVYALVRTIPAGKVSTYGAVAAALSVGCARSVGQAMRSNPFACSAMP